MSDTSIYPEWEQLINDLSLLHPLMLQALRTTMCFIVLDERRSCAATIVRIPSSEFPNTIATTPMRLHIGLGRTQYADLFFFYTVVADEKDLWWAETWIYPYDDEAIGPAADDPLSKESRKKLNLLLNQRYSYVLIIDENNRLRCARKIPFTKTQRNEFPKLAELLKGYEGKRISLVQAKSALEAYLATISKPQLQQQFELLLREEQDTIQINFNCVSCQSLLSVLGQDDCSRAICPECGREITVPARQGNFMERGTIRQLATYSITTMEHLDEARFPTFEDRLQAVSRIDADFRNSFGRFLNKKPSATVDKSSGHVSLTYETIYIDARHFREIKAFLVKAFKPYQSDPEMRR